MGMRVPPRSPPPPPPIGVQGVPKYPKQIDKRCKYCGGLSPSDVRKCPDCGASF